MIITAVFALLLTGCGTRVSHDTLIELSVNCITEYQNRVNDIHPKSLDVSINELAQKEGLETRVATSEYSGKEYQYSRAYLDDGTEYSISATATSRRLRTSGVIILTLQSSPTWNSLSLYLRSFACRMVKL